MSFALHKFPTVALQFIYFSKMDNGKFQGMQDEIQKLQHELQKLHEIEQLERQTNEQLEFQVNELREKLTSTDIQKDLEANLEIAELNKKIIELQKKLDKLADEYEKKIEESRMEYDKMNDMLEREKTKIKRFEAQSHDLEASQKMIDELMQQISSLEGEKMEIAKQYEKYSSLSDDIANYKRQIFEMTENIEVKERTLEQERASRESVQHSQDELLRKMKQLQQDNDELVVKLEGLKSENDTLLNKNKKLENRIKNLEDANKKYLREVNETLKMPIPQVKGRDTMIANSSRDIQMLQEILEKPVALSVSPPPSLPHSYSSSPPNLSVPSVKVHDEKRPLSAEKDLKIIPKIVEPQSHGSEAQKDITEHTNDEVSTIPRDSSAGTSGKIYADMFSRSGNNFYFKKLNSFV